MAHATTTLDRDRLSIGSVAAHLGLPGLLVGAIALSTAAAIGLRNAGDDDHMINHFFHSYLTAYSFFMAITLGSIFFVLLHYLTRAGWSTSVRRIAEGLSLNMFLMVILIFPFFIRVGPQHANGVVRLFHWFNDDARATDDLLQAKAGYLNPTFFAIRMGIYFVFWSLLAWFFSSKSVEQDETGDPRITKMLEKIAMPSIILFGFSLTAFAFDWIMSLNPHWFSTIFGVYYFAGCFLSAVCVITLLSLALQRRGLLGSAVSHEHYHDLGKWMFAFTFFWGYIAFAQYMLIWYANMPEETQFYIPRQIHHWGSLSLVLLAVHLLIPFPGLLSRHVKRKNTILAFWAVWSLCACAVDQYWLVMPNQWISGPNGIAMEVARNPDIPVPDVLSELLNAGHPENATHNIYEVTSAHQNFNEVINYPFQPTSILVTVLCFMGLGGFYLFSTMLALRGKNLVPTKDPRLNEALAFENI